MTTDITKLAQSLKAAATDVKETAHIARYVKATIAANIQRVNDAGKHSRIGRGAGEVASHGGSLQSRMERSA